METNWYGLVVQCLADIFFYQSGEFRFNSSQCNNLCHAFISKLSKHCPIDWHLLSLTREVQCKQTETSSPKNADHHSKQIIQRAWKEVYRAMKESELYLQKCSAPNWWKESVTLSNNGEAHAIHIHDLVWSILCLDLNILYAQGTPHNNYNSVACRKNGDFLAEMSNLIRIHDEFVDKKQLVSTFYGILQNPQHKIYVQRAQRRMNIEDENKIEVAKFLSAKLQATIRLEPAMIDTVPSWLQINPEDLIPKQKPIGQGSYGAVYQGTWLGLRVAVKEIPAGAYDLFQKEALILAQLKNPFIVDLIGTCVKDECCYLIMELVSSSLETKIEENSKEKETPFPLHVALDIMLQISRGMEYLHSQRIMHMDLKASNVLIEPSAVPEFRDEGYGRVKLCDFGMAGLKLYSFRSSFPKGTSYWRAPEAFAYPEELKMGTEVPKEYTYKADVYSFAMTCYEILTGKQPFEDVPNINLYRTILQGERPILPSSCPLPLADYIKRCWDTDPCDRPSFPDVSKFLRYMKLLVMRNDDPRCVSWSSVCKDFDKLEIDNCNEGLDERVTNEEERLIIRALNGDFPKFFQPRPSLQQIAQPLSPRMKFLVSLPDYIQKYSYEEVQNATEKFKREISGASLSMWEGVLSDGTHVAVKLNCLENFLNEVSVLSQIHHPNIIRLRGVSTGNACYLVYDHMVMGSLNKQLFSTGDIYRSHILNWNMRRRIAMGIARSLAYIHGDCGKRFLNVAVDSSNILLDERFTAKLCGFGSAIPVDVNYGSPSSVDRFRFYRSLQHEELKNIYSFGVILLEILTGCRWVDMQYLVYSLHKSVHAIGSKTIMDFLDYQLEGEIQQLEATRLMHLALWCFVKDPFPRPTMSKAVLVMEGLSGFPTPPPLGSVKYSPLI